jgi:hypothetical protein
MDRTELRCAPPVDRAVLAMTQLHMLWELSGLDAVTDAMIEDSAKSWAIDDDEAHEIATFLAEFMLKASDDDDDDESDYGW